MLRHWLILRLNYLNSRQAKKGYVMKKDLTTFAHSCGTLFNAPPKWMIMVLVIALFVLAAGAPNATIGIGK